LTDNEQTTRQSSAWSLAGVAKTSMETLPLINPVLHGAHLTWWLAITNPVCMTPTHDVTFDDDTLTGTVKVGILPPSSVNGTRVIEQGDRP
jgi:hypothetical protein